MSETIIKYKYFILSGTTLLRSDIPVHMQYLLSTGHMVFYNLNHAATLARLAYFKNPSVSNLAPSMLPKISIIVPIYEEPIMT